MSIDVSGGDLTVTPAIVSISIAEEHPLIKLAKALPWALLIAVVVEDLKRTTPKGMWWTGRKIRVRLHLAAYLLQKIYDLTDRQVEYGIKDNAAYQLFCGKGIVAEWHPPDHTKIETFRSRLSPETQRLLANETAKVAVTLGLADPRETDIDSTVQEANIAYPADANLMTKLVGLGKKLIDYLKEKTRGFVPKGLTVDMKAMKAKARAYFFLSKNTPIERRRDVFKDLHRLAKQQMRPILEACAILDPCRLARMPWNIRRAFEQITSHAWRYLLDVAHFTRAHTIKAGKILSLHAKEVGCVKKGKVGKDKEFGRVFQLGRIKGNFLFVMASTTIKMDDKQAFIPMLAEHAALFGERALNSLSADKGYWSGKNNHELAKRRVKENGLQRPVNIRNKKGLPSSDIQERLRDRRAGIEALIGLTKRGGQLGRSRMKSDAATLAAGYASVLGFNLRQISRRQRQDGKKAA